MIIVKNNISYIIVVIKDKSDTKPCNKQSHIN